MLARIKDQVKEYFEDRGVTTADFPKAFIAHEFLSVAFLALTWAGCYQIQPSQSPLFSPVIKPLQESNNFVMVKMRESYQTVIAKAERRMGQEWFSQRGIDTGRVVVSLAESTVFRKLAKPVTIPAKLWLTWKFVQVVNLAHEDDKATADKDDRTPSSKKGRRGTDGGGVAGRTAATTVVTDRQAGRGKAEPPRGRGGVSSASHGGGGWGRREGGKRRKAAICPPGGGRGPGCFIPTLKASRGIPKPLLSW